MPSWFTPKNDQLVTMLPPMASTARPRSAIILSQRACRMRAFHSMIISAPFSFGPQPPPPDRSQRQAKQHRRPADEHRRGIEVRYRWTAGDVNAHPKRAGMEQECEENERRRRPVERPIGEQPAENRRQTRDDVQHQ